ncbi:dedicator of cytokinesis protein 7-like protein, partial [Euroglyphus maynei]
NVDIRHRLAKILAAASNTAGSVITNSNNSDDCFEEKAMMTILCHQNNMSDESLTINATGNSLYCDTSISDLVDPIDDYEDYIAKHSDRIGEQLRSVLLFPFDDVMVEKYQPPLRTLEPESVPEFNNLRISEDPYIQCIGACNLKSLIVIKRYEKNSSELKSKQTERFKRLKRQEYDEVEFNSPLTNNDSLSVIESTTPNTLYSCETMTKNTPRPQSLISSSSTVTVRPPLASDEEDFTTVDDKDGDDGEEREGSRTPLALELINQSGCDNISLHQTRNSWTFIDETNNDDDGGGDQQITNNEDRKRLFFIKNVQNTDVHIQNILEKNYDDYFTEQINYDITVRQQQDDNKNALPLFCLYRLQQQSDDIEQRPSISPPSDVPRYRFLLKCLSLEMDLEIEPLFASIAIYDSKARKKMTETFHFDLNSGRLKSMKHLLKPHVPFQDLSTLSKSAIFSLSHLSADMYFVIKLEKIFQSDINELIEAYQRPPDDSNKMDRLRNAMKNNCKRLGAYRMFFAWAVFPLVDVLSSSSSSSSNRLATTPTVEKDGESLNCNNRNSSNSLDSLKRIANEYTSTFVRKGSLERHLTMTSNYPSNSAISTKSDSMMSSEDLCQAYSQFKPVTITSKIFYRHEAEKFSDEDLYKFLAEFERSSYNNKRVRYIPSTFKLDISPVRDENSIKCRVNPELVRLHPYTGNDQISPIKEMLEFRDLLIPHIEHRNLLYVYPRTVNFTSRQNSARNVTIKLQVLSSEERFSAMSVIFGKSSCPEYLTEAYTAINYHNRNPNFSEEFKIRSPSQLTKQTHLLFTFIHVHTKPKNDVPINEIVGYTWLPLLRDDCLQTGTFSLPIVSEMPTAGYSFLNPNDMEAMTNLKWIDNRKPLFVVHIDSYSSIFAQDVYVDRFFRITSSLESDNLEMTGTLHSNSLYEEFCRAINGLQNSNIDSLVKFVHIIMNRLIMLMVRPPSSLFEHEPNNNSCKFKSLVFETLVAIVARINSKLYADDYSLMQTGILATFIHYQAIFPQPEPNNNERNEEEMMVGSTFHEQIVMQWLSLKEHCNESTAENLNKEIDEQAKINDELFEMKVSFLRIICGHEHFVALNLPFGTPLFAALEQSSNNCNSKFSPSFPLTKEMLDSNIFSNLIFDRIRPYSELTDDYRRQHWLIGLAFCVLLESFTMPKHLLQNRAAHLIRSIMNAFDWDDRFKEATETLLLCLIWTIGNVDHRLFIQYLNEFSNERLLAFLELLRMAMRMFEYQGKSWKRKQSYQKLDDAVRNGPARKELIRRRDYSQSFGPTDGNSDMRLRRKRGSTITRYHSILDPRGNEMNNNSSNDYEDEMMIEGHLCTMVNLIVLDSITMIVNIFRQRIKCISSFFIRNSSTASSSPSSTSLCLRNKYGNDEFVVASAMHALLQLFSLRQSSRVLEAAFDTERAILHHFPELLFIDGLPDGEFCSELCYLLLKHCASQTLAIRANASASIYLLLRQYYQSNGHYSRIKIQITMSLSQLVGTSLTLNEINIRNALNNILLYALNDDSVRETQFPNQVRELVYNLIMILSDTMQMKEHEKDPLMLLDLMYRVAKGYQNSPELRITWLENMAKKHLELLQNVEAAQCLVHAAALVSECLHKMSRRSYLPVSCAAFQRVCPNVFEESLHCNSDVNIDRMSYFKDDIDIARKDVQSAKLNESGLIALLEHAAEHFDASGMYEAVNEIYKLLLPIHETHYNYKELSRIHDRLHKVFIRIEQQQGKRVFATYFRVGFYGKLFNDLNQKEFIYKEPFLTKLPEIANRLETFYGKCFGPKNVEVIKDSNNVDMSKLDLNKGNFFS